jgi:hypothetical protein
MQLNNETMKAHLSCGICMSFWFVIWSCLISVRKKCLIRSCNFFYHSYVHLNEDHEYHRENEKTLATIALVKALSAGYPGTGTIFSRVSEKVPCHQYVTCTWSGSLLKIIPVHGYSSSAHSWFWYWKDGVSHSPRTIRIYCNAPWSM